MGARPARLQSRRLLHQSSRTHLRRRMTPRTRPLLHQSLPRCPPRRRLSRSPPRQSRDRTPLLRSQHQRLSSLTRLQRLRAGPRPRPRSRRRLIHSKSSSRRRPQRQMHVASQTRLQLPLRPPVTPVVPTPSTPPERLSLPARHRRATPMQSPMRRMRPRSSSTRTPRVLSSRGRAQSPTRYAHRTQPYLALATDSSHLLAIAQP